MANRRFTQFFYTLHQKPVLLDCHFTVDATNSYGVTNLKGPGIQNVFMHTSTTPATGNPNPANGYAIVQFQDNYNSYFFGGAEFHSPLSGSEISISGSSVLTIGVPYVITTVGTSTAANWQAVGLPVGITPAVGVSFVATATGSGTGTGKVKISATAGSGIGLVDLIGNPNTTILSSAPTVLGISSGAYVILRFLAPSFAADAYTPAGTVAAPTFTGSALATHVHNLLVKGGQASATTNRIANYSGPLLGKEEATDATYVGANSATSGGVVAVTAGTPAGSNSAPAFTGTAASLTGTVSWAATAPVAGTIVRLSFLLSNSGLLNAGE